MYGPVTTAIRMTSASGGDAVAVPDDVTAVAVGGQEPVEVQRHPVSSRKQTLCFRLVYYTYMTRRMPALPDQNVPWSDSHRTE
jgi:hypothetical protein